MSFLPFESSSVVNFPCDSCSGKQNNSYEFIGTIGIDEFRNKKYVNSTDFKTYVSINELQKDEDIRVYKCRECDHKIGYFLNSGCRYIC